MFLKDNQSELISNKDAQIAVLEKEIEKLNEKIKSAEVPLPELAKEAKINYPLIKSISYAKVITSDLKKTDTILVFEVFWDKKMRRSDKLKQRKKLGEWLKYKLKLDTLLIK